MKNRISAWIVLGVITIAAGLGLAVTNQVTMAPIKQQALIAEDRAKKLVMPDAETFEEIELPDGGVLFAAKAGDKVIGYVGKGTGKGYGGQVEVIAGFKEDGTITGVNVGGASFSETPGLGAKARSAEFTSQFIDKTSPVKLGDSAKAGEVDAITAATITSNAVVSTVNNLARQVRNYLNPEADKPAVTAEGTTYAGEAEGFKGPENPVYVEVTVKDDGTISALKVGDARFAETEGFGAAALEPDFSAQFIGKSVPLKEGDVDGISGATSTNRAVIAAINKAFEDKNIVGPAKPEGTTYAGEAEGFKGPENPVYVEVTVKDDGTISALKVGDARFAETEGYGAAALEPDFSAQFIGKSVPLQEGDVDGISGATYTNRAVIAAINKAFEDKNIVSGDTAPEATATKAPAPTPEPLEVVVPGNAVSASGKGFEGPVAVTVAFDDDGKITFIKIGDENFKETEGLGAEALKPAFQDQFIGKLPPLHIRSKEEAVSEATIDSISGATITTSAVIDTINALHLEQHPQTSQPEETPGAAGEGLVVTREGFMGPVSVRTVFEKDGSIKRVEILPEGFKETAGYGALATGEAYLAQFTGKLPPLIIRGADQKETQGTVENLVSADASTSATRTAQAIVEAVNEAHAMYLAGQGKTVTKQGFMGPVTVKVSFDGQGAISEFAVEAEGFKETPGYGAGALQETFAAQFIGKLPPLAIRKPGEAESDSLVEPLQNIDTMTSATLTLQAILDAVNEAFAQRP